MISSFMQYILNASFSSYREISESFGATGMEYFNTFGGNPVSAAISNAVLDVIENEKLMEHAAMIGNYLKQEFNKLKENHMLIGKLIFHFSFYFVLSSFSLCHMLLCSDIVYPRHIILSDVLW